MSYCVYKITDLRSDEIVYVGKTNNFNNRRCMHFTQSKQYVDQYMLEQCRENFEMSIIQDGIESNDNAVQIEDELIVDLNPIMNKQRSGHITKDDLKKYHSEYYRSEKVKDYKREYQKSEKAKDYQREYHRSEKAKERQKEYYQKNKEQKLSYQKQYNQKNKDYYIEYQRQYRLKKKQQKSPDMITLF